MLAVKMPYVTTHPEITPVPALKASLEIPLMAVSTSTNVNSRVSVDLVPSVEMSLVVGNVSVHRVTKEIPTTQDAETWTNAREATLAVETLSAQTWRAALSVLVLQGSLETP